MALYDSTDDYDKSLELDLFIRPLEVFISKVFKICKNAKDNHCNRHIIQFYTSKIE